jgi:hypothetical protein
MLIDIILTMLAAYFVKQEYETGLSIWLVLWSMLLGWDIHTLITHL